MTPTTPTKDQIGFDALLEAMAKGEAPSAQKKQAERDKQQKQAEKPE